MRKERLLMSKSHLLYGTLILCGAFFVVQFYLIHNVSKSRDNRVLQTRQQEALQANSNGKNAEQPLPPDLVKSSYENVDEFSALCQQNGVPVFVADVDVLMAVIANSSAAGANCRYLCHRRTATTFAIIASLWRNQKLIFERLHAAGFLINSASEPDPWVEGRRVDTHHLFERHGHVVHLVLLHQPRGVDTFWWHGACRWCSSYVSPGLNQHWVAHEGVIDQTELLKVTMDSIPLRAPRYPKTFYEQVPQSTFIHCNMSQAQRFRQTYGEENSMEAQAFRRDALQLLKDAKRVLDKLGIRFWLSSGTCLGWFRQCDIIPYSKDVDLGIWINDYDDRLIAAMQAAGLRVKHIFGKVSDSYELSFEIADIKLDIFFFYEDSHYMWNGGTQARTGKKFKYLFPKFSLCWTLLLGMRVRVPCDTKAYVEANYGLNWVVPVKKWDWKNSPPNVWENGQWPKEEWNKVIQQF